MVFELIIYLFIKFCKIIMPVNADKIPSSLGFTNNIFLIFFGYTKIRFNLFFFQSISTFILILTRKCINFINKFIHLKYYKLDMYN